PFSPPLSREGNMLTSIITVYYNTPEELLELAASIQAHLPPGSYEWIIADNASKEDLSSRLSWAKYLRMPENYGFARACNLAAEKASGELLFFLNPDCLLNSDCVNILKQAISKSAIAGPRVLNSDGTIQLSFGPSLSALSEAVQKFRTDHESALWMQNWLRKKTAVDFHPDYV